MFFKSGSDPTTTKAPDEDDEGEEVMPQVS